MGTWAKRFFREDIFTPGMPEAASAAPAEVKFLARVLRLGRKSRALDVCCGTGRHALRLARRGVTVVGVDATASYLAAARKAARGAPRVKFVRKDMRRLAFREEFDAAYNVWTSFGYFADARDDIRALRAMARALKPGGLLLIDVQDGDWLKRHFEAVRTTPLAGGAQRVEFSRLRFGRDPALVAEWMVFRRGQKPRRAAMFVRLYDEKRLRAALKRAGLKPLRRWSSLGGRGKDRLVLLARREQRA